MHTAEYSKMAGVLIEALPYIQRLAGKTVVIKYGGNAMVGQDVIRTILEDITLLKYVGINPILVHGGGPEINNMLKKMEIESRFVGGLRVTDAPTMEVVQMVLAGKINKDIVSQLNQMGAKAIGLSGKDGSLIKVSKKTTADGTDLGYVGEVEEINVKLLNLLAQDEYIPVIAPIGVGEDGHSYNINADTVAGAVAAALKAEKLIFLTDIIGICKDHKDPSTLIPVISKGEIEQMITSGAIEGGMIPKVRGCIQAVDQGVVRTHILNGTLAHPIIMEIFTDRGIGTMVTA